MAYISKKNIKGKDYYYFMESKRINGKPVHSKQIYLGTAEDVLEKLSLVTGAQPPLYSKDLDLGAVAALYHISKKLGVIEMIDAISGKRNQGLSTGHYLLAAIINRAVSPFSRSGLEEWYENTMLREWMPVTDGMLKSQRFWDNVSRWTEDKIDLFELQFLRKISTLYNLKPKCLIYDATNFFTYIDTSNEKASLAKRGHSKEKRNDLRIVGLSLMFSREDEMPLFYEVYEGNTNDSKQFDHAITHLKEKYYKVFGEEAEVTLVFDHGNNSIGNIKNLSETENTFCYVGGLKKNQCKELFEVPDSQYQEARSKELSGMTYYRTKGEVYGKEHTIISTRNPALLDGQLQGIVKNETQCIEKIRDLEERLEKRRSSQVKGGKKPTVESIKKNMDKILSIEYIKTLFHYEVRDGEDGIPVLEWRYNKEELDWLKEHELGKTVLFTDQSEWESEEIIKAYRSAWRLEHTFRQMKDADYLTVRPLFCWTDQKIRVHLFCCVMAVRLCYLLKKELAAQGIQIGINDMLETLGKKKQYVHYYQQKRKLKEGYSVSMPCEQTENLMDALGLKMYEKKS